MSSSAVLKTFGVMLKHGLLRETAVDKHDYVGLYNEIRFMPGELDGSMPLIDENNVR